MEFLLGKTMFLLLPLAPGHLGWALVCKVLVFAFLASLPSIILQSRSILNKKGLRCYLWQTLLRDSAFIALRAVFFASVATGQAFIITFPVLILDRAWEIVVPVCAAALGALLPFVPCRFPMPKSSNEKHPGLFGIGRSAIPSCNGTFEAEIERTAEEVFREDVSNCLAARGSWDLGLSPRTVAWRLNMIAGDQSENRARYLRDTRALRMDLGVSTLEKCHLLLRHLGRARLRELLLNPPALGPTYSWDGVERRRKGGTAANRLQPDPYPQFTRKYDSPYLLARIALGA